MKSTSALRPPPGRPHVERQLVGVALRGEAHDVDAARQVLRHREVEVGGPARVVEVVLVEVDGRVLARGVAPAHLAPRPARAGDRAGGQVHQPPAEAVGADVDDVEPVDAPGEVPAGDEPVGRQQGVEHHRLGRGGRDREQQRILDLAVPVLAGLPGQARPEQQRRPAAEAGPPASAAPTPPGARRPRARAGPRAARPRRDRRPARSGASAAGRARARWRARAAARRARRGAR